MKKIDSTFINNNLFPSIKLIPNANHKYDKLVTFINEKGNICIKGEKMEKKPIIVFDNSIKSKVISSLGFEENEDSKLVENNGKLATSQDFESISSDEFGGVLQGSKIPIKNKDTELVKYFISGKC